MAPLPTRGHAPAGITPSQPQGRTLRTGHGSPSPVGVVGRGAARVPRGIDRDDTARSPPRQARPRDVHAKVRAPPAARGGMVGDASVALFDGDLAGRPQGAAAQLAQPRLRRHVELEGAPVEEGERRRALGRAHVGSLAEPHTGCRRDRCGGGPPPCRTPPGDAADTTAPRASRSTPCCAHAQTMASTAKVTASSTVSR
jgi:hypothetical protein